MQLRQSIGRLLNYFGFSEVDENALVLLEKIGDTYLKQCCQYREKVPENFMSQALPYLGNSCSNLLAYRERYNYLAHLNEEPEKAAYGAPIEYVQVPFQDIFTGNMAEQVGRQ